jgi:hypothetical protein
MTRILDRYIVKERGPRSRSGSASSRSSWSSTGSTSSPIWSSISESDVGDRRRFRQTYFSLYDMSLPVDSPLNAASKEEKPEKQLPLRQLISEADRLYHEAGGDRDRDRLLGRARSSSSRASAPPSS